MRTLFFDHVVSLVTWRGEGPGAAPAGIGCHARLLAAVRAAPQCLQVVLLGSGLDARPWRLALPPGVRWFEVDRRDVLAAKVARLRALGAGLKAPRVAKHQPQSQSELQQPNTSHAATLADASQAGGSETAGAPFGGDAAARRQDGAVAHPLRATSWASCAVDLCQRGWSRGLLRCGLDPRAPVCWVLEGLLYYLEEEDVRALLKEAASVSGRGSILAASVIKARADQTGPQRPVVTVEASAASGDHGQLSAALGRPAVPLPGATATVTLAASEDVKDKGVAAAVDAQSPTSSDSSRQHFRLQEKFVWKCRQEVPQFFRECGWRADSFPWLEAARSYGLPTGESRASSVCFVMADLA